MVVARQVAPADTASVGWFSLPSGRLAFGRTLHVALSLVALILTAFGAAIGSPVVTTAICAVILVFGLPHGAFDLALIKRAHNKKRLSGVVALYLFFAAAMFALWHAAPALALLIFFVLSIIHFAEDWTDRLPPFLAHGTATALLSTPAILHQDIISALFALLVGDAAAGMFTAVAILIAPASLAAAAVGTVVLWLDGHRRHAVATAMALCSMIILPPVIGFALFFCLMHSPAQFASAQRTLDWHRARHWLPVIAPLTCAALGIAAFVFATLETVTLTDTMIGTAFMTLSILTLPHLVVPMIVARLARATA